MTQARYTRKSLFYTLFKLGGIPPQILPVLETEGIELKDEGMSGWAVYRNVRGPQRRFIYKQERISSCLVITKKRIICYTFGKRQINIETTDPRLSKINIFLKRDNKLVISFDSSIFSDLWSGVIEFSFNTDMASDFLNRFKEFGMTETTE